jgi:hypothetical protein
MSKIIERHADDITLTGLVSLRVENTRLKEALSQKMESTAGLIEDMYAVIKNIDQAYMDRQGERVMFEYARKFLVEKNLL